MRRSYWKRESESQTRHLPAPLGPPGSHYTTLGGSKEIWALALQPPLGVLGKVDPRHFFGPDPGLVQAGDRLRRILGLRILQFGLAELDVFARLRHFAFEPRHLGDQFLSLNRVGSRAAPLRLELQIAELLGSGIHLPLELELFHLMTPLPDCLLGFLGHRVRGVRDHVLQSHGYLR